MAYRYKFERRLLPDELSKDEPVLVLCQNYSRVATDVIDATKDLSDIPDSKMAVIILHAKRERALPFLKTIDTITTVKCKQFGLLVDIAYIDGTIYSCKMNSEGLHTLQLFLQQYFKPEAERAENIKPMSVPKDKTVVAKPPEIMSEDIALQKGDKDDDYIAQFYKQTDSDQVERFLKSRNIGSIPHLKEEKSMTDLDTDTYWLILCEKGSYVEKEVLKGQTRNEKVLVLIKKDSKETYEVVNDKQALIINVKLNSDTKYSSMLDQIRKEPNTDDRFEWFLESAEAFLHCSQQNNPPHIGNILDRAIEFIFG